MEPLDFAKSKTSYRKLYAFQKAEAIYDLTYHFLQRNISRHDRTHDQMLQAARSGKQNIVEGRSDAGSSAEMEIKLYGVARGSLHELLNDYLDFMRTRGIPKWTIDHPRTKKLRETSIKHNDTSYYMKFSARLNNEELCNLIITLIYQTISMISKLIELVKEDFLRKGGIKEQMYKARLNYRNSNTNQK
ncbi:MAG: four helix bundle protein [Bacteroides sp.]|nr:four helix bundle protein [Bacteroides sp.]